MKPASQFTEKHHKKFSPLLFTLSVGATVGIFILTLSTFFPSIWAQQLSGGTLPIIWVALSFHLFNALFEFFFHRYVLHSDVFRWLIKFYKEHTLHHALTKVFQEKPKTGEDVYIRRVVSNYPIVEPKQYQSSFFPYWGLAGFSLFFSPLVLLLQWRLPHMPILLGGFVAVTFSYCLYELLHALEHVPYEAFWKKFVESPGIIGTAGRKIYGFHQFHHANVFCNMAISGFFGLPVFDLLCGTYKQPRQLLLDGTLARRDDFSAPKPRWFIRWLDSHFIKTTAARR